MPTLPTMATLPMRARRRATTLPAVVTYTAQPPATPAAIAVVAITRALPPLRMPAQPQSLLRVSWTRSPSLACTCDSAASRSHPMRGPQRTPSWPGFRQTCRQVMPARRLVWVASMGLCVGLCLRRCLEMIRARVCPEEALLAAPERWVVVPRDQVDTRAEVHLLRLGVKSSLMQLSGRQ